MSPQLLGAVVALLLGALVALLAARRRTAARPEFVAWAKSSYSGGGENNACVEVAHNDQGLTGIRDTKDKEVGPILAVPHVAWRAFLRDVAP